MIIHICATELMSFFTKFDIPNTAMCRSTNLHVTTRSIAFTNHEVTTRIIVPRNIEVSACIVVELDVRIVVRPVLDCIEAVLTFLDMGLRGSADDGNG
jgi:hypothetical protein